MAKVSRSMLVAAVAEGANFHRNEVDFVSQRMFFFIGEALKNGEPVKLNGFGSFQIRRRAERKGRNPRTGETHVVTARRTVLFLPSERLLRKLN